MPSRYIPVDNFPLLLRSFAFRHDKIGQMRWFGQGEQHVTPWIKNHFKRKIYKLMRMASSRWYVCNLLQLLQDHVRWDIWRKRRMPLLQLSDKKNDYIIQFLLWLVLIMHSLVRIILAMSQDFFLNAYAMFRADFVPFWLGSRRRRLLTPSVLWRSGSER